MQEQLIARSDQVWARSGILQLLPATLRVLTITSDTSLPAGPVLRGLLGRFTALQSLKLAAGYGVTCEQVGRPGGVWQLPALLRAGVWSGASAVCLGADPGPQFAQCRARSCR